jgi:hypothetical protein
LVREWILIAVNGPPKRKNSALAITREAPTAHGKGLFAGASVIVPRPIVGGGHGTLRGNLLERSGMTKPVFRYHHLLFSLMIIGRDSTSFRIL